MLERLNDASLEAGIQIHGLFLQMFPSQLQACPENELAIAFGETNAICLPKDPVQLTSIGLVGLVTIGLCVAAVREKGNSNNKE